jgi:hypothetical protein
LSPSVFLKRAGNNGLRAKGKFTPFAALNAVSLDPFNPAHSARKEGLGGLRILGALGIPFQLVKQGDFRDKSTGFGPELSFSGQKTVRYRGCFWRRIKGACLYVIDLLEFVVTST